MADKKKRTNVFAKLFKYLRECVGELKKITWPTFSQTTKNFGVVLLVIIAASILIFALDKGLYALLSLIMKLGQG
ncbi:MAG: preprotein translocase subunit SecE [Ruminococcus sp.]|nr:preprotein translocase subunit SecE [Ruminococcus sp.]